jgi:predicted acetyltransferase
LAIDYRVPEEEELRAALAIGSVAFSEELRDDDYERARKTLERERVLCAYDDGTPVGVAAALTFRLTVPGGEVPAAGVTWVGVAPTHRRRGILREFMRRQLADVHERGEPLAILWASEAAIYGRFGYGLAAPNANLDAERDRVRFRDDPGPVGKVRFATLDEARSVLPGVYERVRAETPGMLTRSHAWWEHERLADPEHIRQGASQKFCVVLELNGRPEGYALYRVKSEWEHGLPKGQVRIVEAFGTSTAATREIWRFLLGVDLVTRVQAWIFDPHSPLFLMVTDPRRLRLTLGDGLWLRLVDLEAALRSRSYAGEHSIVLEVGDELCPWNAGRWRVGAADGARTDEPADLRLDTADLASVYLGAFDFDQLAAAGRAEELSPDALARANELFRTRRRPFCPEIF